MQNYHKVGILALIALLALGMIVMWKSDLVLRQGGYQLTGVFQQISGLTVGSEVRYRGLKVGKIIKIDPGPDDIRVYAVISNKIKFPAESSLRVAFDGLVGMKYLEILPVHSAGYYQPGQVLNGESSSGIVDFVDLGSQSLEETKKILQVIRSIIERPDIQMAFMGAVLNAEKVTEQINQLSIELRRVTASIDKVVSDPKFQSGVKGVAEETAKTLTSANNFFEATGNLRLRPSGDVLIGTRNNEIRANIDIVPSELRRDYYRFGIGEGPAVNQGLSLQDILVARQVGKTVGLRIGMINSSLGGGVEYYPNPVITLTADVYKINNNPNWPKLRLTAADEVTDFMDLTVRVDDVLNNGPNYSMGVSIKSR